MLLTCKMTNLSCIMRQQSLYRLLVAALNALFWNLSYLTSVAAPALERSVSV